jgi:hypothetical protein
VVSTLKPVRSPVSTLPLTSGEEAIAELPLAATTSAMVAKAAASATNIVEGIGCLRLRKAAPNRVLALA